MHSGRKGFHVAVTAHEVGVSTDPRELLRSLLQHHASSDGRAEMLSVFVDLDPSDHPTSHARRAHVLALLEQARRDALDPGWRTGIGDVARQLEQGSGELDRARALAIYCSSDGQVAEAISLQRSVRPRFEFGPAAVIRPIVETLAHGTWCVVLANGTGARLLLGNRDGLEEIAAVRDDVFAEVDEGGFDERSKEWERLRAQHVTRVVDAIGQLHDDQPFDHLLIAAPEPVDGLLAKALPKPMCDRLAGWFRADVDSVSIAQVQELAAPFIEQCSEAEELAVFERLRAGADTGGSALGVEAVLTALGEHRVETLVVAEDFTSGGSVCQTCGGLSSLQSHHVCPADNGPMYPTSDIVERAVQRAVLTGAHIVNVGRDSIDTGAAFAGTYSAEPRASFTELVNLGGIGATLRY